MRFTNSKQHIIKYTSVTTMTKTFSSRNSVMIKYYFVYSLPRAQTYCLILQNEGKPLDPKA